MYDVSDRFLDALTGSHRAVARVQVLPTANMPQFGPAPTGGVELPLLGGDVKLTSTADVNGSVDFTISGDYWDVLQPYGAELFVERGIDFGDGTRELVPCGYYGIEEISRDGFGPARVTGFDRGKRLQRNRVVYPIEFPAGSTHRAIFEHLVNGTGPAGQPIRNYGMFGPDVPIIFTGYDPDLAKIGTSLTCEDDAHALLSKIADARGCVLRFARTGELLVQPRNLPPGAEPVYTVRPGPAGNLVNWSQKVTRDGVYNIVVARGSDPANPTGYRLAYNDDPTHPLYWTGPFGKIVRYYASPLIQSFEAADVAAESVLARYRGLPTSLSMMAVPNPALDPLDVVQATLGSTTATHLVDQVTIPLVGSDPVEIVTRTLNEVPTDEDPPSGGGSFPNPSDPGTDPDPGGGGGTVTLAPPANHQSVMDAGTRIVTTSWTLTPGSDATEVHEFLGDPANTLKATITAPGTTRVSGPQSAGERQYAVRAVKGTERSGFSNRVRILADGTSVADGDADPGGGTGGTGGTADLTTAAGRFNWGAPLPQSDDFTSATLDTTKWSVYNGPGHGGNGRRLPARVAIVNGVLTLTGLANGDSAGMAHRFNQQYGRWEVRCRSSNTSTSGETYHPVLIIWPESDEWPEDGEYDFLENSTPGDDHAGAFIHYPHPSSVPVQQEQATKAGVDLTQWHNVAFEWTPNGVKGFIDGVEWFSYSGGAISGRRSNIQAMPSGHLTIQLDNFNGSSGNREGKFEIDWVRVYTLVPQGTGGGSGGGSGGGGASTGTLAQRLRLGTGSGLNKANLGVGFLSGDGPSGKTGQHVDYPLNVLTQSSLPAELGGYVDLRPDGAVRLTAYVGGGTTPNSTRARTEFRALALNGVDKESFSTTSGEHYLWCDGAVVRVPPNRKRMCIAQCHGGDDDLCMIMWEGGTVFSTYGDTGRPGTLATGVALGSRHQWMIKIRRVGSQTQIGFYWDDMSTPKATQNYAGGAGNYWKFGAYQQSATEHDEVGEMAILDLWDAEIWHTGYPEPAARH